MKKTEYIIQTNLDGSYDIMLATNTTKIVGNTPSIEAAKELIRLLNINPKLKPYNHGKTSSN